MRRGAWDNSAARQRSISAGGSSISSVYVTISPEAAGCSALLLLIGTCCPPCPVRTLQLSLVARAPLAKRLIWPPPAPLLIAAVRV